jgi:hypothetical protein
MGKMMPQSSAAHIGRQGLVLAVYEAKSVAIIGSL